MESVDEAEAEPLQDPEEYLAQLQQEKEALEQQLQEQQRQGQGQEQGQGQRQGQEVEDTEPRQRSHAIRLLENGGS